MPGASMITKKSFMTLKPARSCSVKK